MTEPTPADLLRLAARLVDRATARLDGSYRTCDGCGAKRYNHFEQGKVVERLEKTAPHLRTVADALDVATAQATIGADVDAARAELGRKGGNAR